MNLNATLFIEVLSFLILLGLLIKFLYQPVLNILDKRVQAIKEAEQRIQEGLASAEGERSRAEATLAASKEKALKIKEKVSQDAELARQRIIHQAKIEAARTLHACQEEIANETKKAKEEIKNEVIDLSVKTAEKILRREFGAKDQKRLVKELTDEIK